MGLSDDPRLDRAFLEAHGFDAERFDEEVAQLKAGQLTAEGSIIRAPMAPVPTRDLDRSAEARRLGEAALERGEVAVVVLNGGMATRFGGVVKGVVEVAEDKSFIGLKAEDLRRAGERFGPKPVFVLMNSFATAGATAVHLAQNNYFGLDPERVLSFEQTISARLTPNAELFIGRDGKPSFHAPGHGDFFPCIRNSGVLDRLRSMGVKHVLFSNVDNLGATLDPQVIGHHLGAEAQMTVEVTEKRRVAGQWDKGGAPALVDGRPIIVEGFRFPAEFEQSELPDFSTNTFHFELKALDRSFRLPRHVVIKEVDGQSAIQLESIACEASHLLEPDGSPSFRLELCRVSRDDAEGRFFPVKRPDDLERLKSTLMERLRGEWTRR
ncbi:MAG: UTP--glucose-1-phosphate uridylyltransferase [Myxococcota bacterium]